MLDQKEENSKEQEEEESLEDTKHKLIFEINKMNLINILFDKINNHVI